MMIQGGLFFFFFFLPWFNIHNDSQRDGAFRQWRSMSTTQIEAQDNDDDVVDDIRFGLDRLTLYV